MVCMMVWDKLFVGNVGDAEAVVGTLRQHKVDHEGFVVVVFAIFILLFPSLLILITHFPPLSPSFPLFPPLSPSSDTALFL